MSGMADDDDGAMLLRVYDPQPRSIIAYVYVLYDPSLNGVITDAASTRPDLIIERTLGGE